ncbi:MAG: hypothetical protein QG636_591 [Patescibacteria group bacterium]|nr:hypothetical protein [Patescibacteria group bacterium]
MNVLTRIVATAVVVVFLSTPFTLTVFAQQTGGGSAGGQTGGGTVGGQTGGGTDGSTNPGCGSESGGLVNPLKEVCSLDDFLKAILGGIIDIGTIILIMMLVYVGFLFVAARGNAEKIQSAKSALVWTVIGGLILLGAKSIQMVITETVKTLS